MSGSMDTIEGVTVVTEHVGNAGAVVMWSMRGDTSIDELAAAWTEQGLDAGWLPQPPTPVTALRRAIGELKGPTRIVRPTQAGWALFDEKAAGTEDELAFTTALKAKVDKVGRLTVTGGTEDERAQMHAAFAKYADHLGTQDVSAWLAAMVWRASAVSLRPTGGVYFVPAFAMPLWERIVRAVKTSSSHNVYAIPALRNEDIVAAVTEGLEKEATEAVEAIEAELAAKTDMKRAPLERRIKTTETIEAKLSSYEKLLGTQLDMMRAKVEAVRAEITKAILTADMAGAA
jgi:hypothetical protein